MLISSKPPSDPRHTWESCSVHSQGDPEGQPAPRPHLPLRPPQPLHSAHTPWPPDDAGPLALILPHTPHSPEGGQTRAFPTRHCPSTLSFALRSLTCKQGSCPRDLPFPSALHLRTCPQPAAAEVLPALSFHLTFYLRKTPVAPVSCVTLGELLTRSVLLFLHL